LLISFSTVVACGAAISILITQQQGTSQVQPLSTGFPWKVLSLRTKLEVPCSEIVGNQNLSPSSSPKTSETPNMPRCRTLSFSIIKEPNIITQAHSVLMFSTLWLSVITQAHSVLMFSTLRLSVITHISRPKQKPPKSLNPKP
jgi:hypothetical protein